ncbi:MAG: rhodanese-like domain-containing protein [SAR324 cluster bacterium]|nr:rhodanese-like domain-containing protein [SAR324 cluster bacterium]MBF0353026.1 rhodanese-like domain-containing protein [SAR324 cluster bacterium]
MNKKLGWTLGLMSVVILGIGLALFSVPPSNVQYVTSQDALALMQTNQGRNDFVLLDLRTPDEYRRGHIPGARLLDFNDAGFDDWLMDLDKNKTYLILCQSGYRSNKAASMMSSMGFTHVYNMGGGMDEWAGQRLPTVR